MKIFSKMLAFSVFALLVLAFSPARSAHARTIEVPCGDVPALIAAIHTANSTPEPDTIILYTPCRFILAAVDNTSPDFGPNGLPVITSKIVIQGGIIERQSEGPFLRFFLVAPSGILVLRQMSLHNGNPGMTDTPDVAYSGGAIYNNQGNVRLKNVNHLFNSVNSGGIGDGGVIYNDRGTVKWMGSRTGYSFAHRGAGIFNSAGGRLTMRNGNFWHSFADAGGGIYNLGQADIDHVSFHSGRAIEGGAFANYGTMTVIASTFTKNGSRVGYDAQSGGAIVNYGPLQIKNSTFSRNKAEFGGAIWNTDTVMFANSTFNLNTAGRNGGAIYNRGTIEILNVTLAYNAAEFNGGNILTKPGATTLVANTIITQGAPLNCKGRIQGEGGNLRYPETDGSCEGGFGDPRLGPLQHNGGPTHTMALEPGSSAINKGLRENCLRELVNNKDQRGVKRLIGDEKQCDSGAVEVQ